MSTCTECLQQKDLSSFYKNTSRNSGYGTQCKVCTMKVRNMTAEERAHRKGQKNAPTLSKKCSQCKQTKANEFYDRKRTGINGRRADCKECVKKATQVRKNKIKTLPIAKTCTTCSKYLDRTHFHRNKQMLGVNLSMYSMPSGLLSRKSKDLHRKEKHMGPKKKTDSSILSFG